MRERGTVLDWKEHKGHGRIQADAGDVVWAHFSQIVSDGFRNLSVGQRVEFDRVTSFGRPGYSAEAHQIKPI